MLAYQQTATVAEPPASILPGQDEGERLAGKKHGSGFGNDSNGGAVKLLTNGVRCGRKQTFFGGVSGLWFAGLKQQTERLAVLFVLQKPLK